MNRGFGVVFSLAIVVSLLTLPGCARVKPYQREYLSERAMQPGAEAAEDAFRAHWQTAREGSEGGFPTAGGGCGCN
jgi:hypothetical protein